MWVMKSLAAIERQTSIAFFEEITNMLGQFKAKLYET